jgi:glycosyltransferase involved in cell wall biosynthesis
MKPLFSVVLIARNESKTLPHAIRSLSEFMARGGDVNVLDTGSTDNTVEVAKSLGCRVKEVGTIFRHEITEEKAKEINDRFIVENEHPVLTAGESYFDFASARNAANSMADCDMVCTMDCDEVITRLDIDKIDQYIRDGYTQFEYNFVFSHLPSGGELVKFIQSKFYSRVKCNWVGIIHEMVTNLDSTNPSKIKLLEEHEFKLEHWQNEETNRTGYLRGLAIDCFDHQEKDRNSHYFARELWWTGRPWSAAKEFKRHIEMNRWPAEKAESMLFLADIYGAMEKPEEQLAWCHKAIDIEPNRREGLLKLAQIYQRRNQPIPANFYATAALELPWYPFYGANVSFYTNEPHEILYWAKGWMGDIAGARKHLLICLDYQRENPAYLRDTQFYFDYAANNIPGWMSFEEQYFLFDNARKMESVIELGSWKGKSTHALLSSKCPKVVAVDTWKGSKFEPEAHAEAATGSVFADFKKNVGHFKNLEIIEGDINDVVKTVEDKSFDMVFIDAGHTYEEVRNDIRKWKGKAKILLCGHDFVSGWPGVIQAVNEELGGPDGVAGTIWYKWVNKPKVSICIPTLGRPEKLNRLLTLIKEKAGYDNYEVIVKADEMPPNNAGAPKVFKRCVDESTGELVMFLGNDVVPQQDFLREAVWAMIRKFPELDGMIGLNDNYWLEQHVAPHFLISKKLLPYLDGEFFHTGYYHTGCDNELRARVEMIGKYAFGKKAEIFHDHPMMAGSKAGMDIFYEQAYGGPRHDADNQLYAERAKKYGFENRNWG